MSKLNLFSPLLTPISGFQRFSGFLTDHEVSMHCTKVLKRKQKANETPVLRLAHEIRLFFLCDIDFFFPASPRTDRKTSISTIIESTWECSNLIRCAVRDCLLVVAIVETFR